MLQYALTTVAAGLALVIIQATADTVTPYPALTIKQASTTDFADPAIYKEHNIWFAYATNYAGNNVQVSVSPDFDEWALLSHYDALPTVGKWVNPDNHMVWAPSIIKNDDGKYIMYYSADAAGKGRHCIGAAVADFPIGPFKPLDEPMFCDVAKGGAIDPSGFQDVDGKRYVVYKVDGNSMGAGGMCGNWGVGTPMPTPIMLQAVEGDGVTLHGEARAILDREDRDGPLIEAPSLVRRGNLYVLFFSSWCYATPQYDVSYAMADSVWGPYTKHGPFAVTGQYDGLVAPGGAEIAADGEHMVFHADSADGKARLMYTARISIDTARFVVSPMSASA